MNKNEYCKTLCEFNLTKDNIGLYRWLIGLKYSAS